MSSKGLDTPRSRGQTLYKSGRTQGIARLVVGLIAAAGMAATIYAGEEPAAAIVGVAAFGLAWFGARAWLRSSPTGFWRTPIGTRWFVIAAGLGPVLSSLLIRMTTPDVQLLVIGADAALIAGLTLSIWFSPHRYELFR
jgi:hypothetical protein